ncbi:hypothetical protein KSP40_PGU003751 [Platanthera guangdongensis]|uniref:ENT domain-containing protein n=1 Tax=Platanthera guangdongensis TaxID=2320717 RepID=A0ABR2LPH2_9ASPA
MIGIRGCPFLKPQTRNIKSLMRINSDLQNLHMPHLDHLLLLWSHILGSLLAPHSFYIRSIFLMGKGGEVPRSGLLSFGEAQARIPLANAEPGLTSPYSLMQSSRLACLLDHVELAARGCFGHRATLFVGALGSWDRHNGFKLVYRLRKHLIDVTEIFSQLNGEKTRRLAKLIYLEKEELITELRKVLKVSDTEHRELLSLVNADDIIRRKN